jgi:hypothetical protein
MENLKNTILEKIETKTIEQKPQWQFVVYGILGIGIGIGILIVTLFLVQFLMLVIHEYTVAHGVGIVGSPIGFAGNVTFWLVLLIGIGLVIVFYRWLQQHTHLYRYKNFYTMIMAVAIIAGLALGIKLFDQSMQFARIGERQIPIIHQLDRAARPPRPNGLLSGKIVMIQNDIIFSHEIWAIEEAINYFNDNGQSEVSKLLNIFDDFKSKNDSLRSAVADPRISNNENEKKRWLMNQCRKAKAFKIVGSNYQILSLKPFLK